MRTASMDRLYSFIRLYQTINGIPPSYKEMLRGTGLKSTQSIHRLIKCLEERGQISRIPGRPRAIKILEDGDQQVPIANLKRWHKLGWSLGDVLDRVAPNNGEKKA